MSFNILRRFSTYLPRLIHIQRCAGLGLSITPEIGPRVSDLQTIKWQAPLKNIYVVKKPWDLRVREAMIEFIGHIHQEYPDVNVIVNENVADEISHELSLNKSLGGNDNTVIYTGLLQDIVTKTDLIVSLGGDGTILQAVSAFANNRVPPVLSFALGTLGFLLPFDFKTFKETFQMVYDSQARALHRTRLQCHVVRKKRQIDTLATPMSHAMNDVSIHRGGQPNLASIDIYINNEFFTTSTGDGMVISTPTGSTAYSLSAGGSITHPLVPCILLTPICPRSLSFRPLIVPSTSNIMIRLTDTNRNASIKLNIDGVSQQDLKPGDELHVKSEAQFPLTEGSDEENGIWCIARGRNDWSKDINELLGFNSSFKGQQKVH